ncbi:MAG: MFS transporter [Lachnoclostridium sp.]|jgi:glycoside/pentoside/hexuronide:cation symporter, GPH family
MGCGNMGKVNGKVTGKEFISYGLYFLGQNIFYMLLYMYMNTYFTDVGISAVAVAIIALIVKVWDAVNDPIFGGIMDKIHFKKGIFIPWLRISLVGIPVTTIILFAIPTNLSAGFKIAWAVIAYMLWDTAYTLCDVPIFGLVTTLTDIQEERTSLNAIGRVAAMIAAGAVMIVIPSFRAAIGGWTATVVMLSVIGAITMVPICFVAKERIQPSEEDKQQDVSLRDMFRYLKGNKFLLIYYLAFLISGTFNVVSNWGLYIARYCLKNEAILSITSILSFIPVVVMGAIIPVICKKIDKFKLYYYATAATLVVTVIKYFVGYSNLAAYLTMAVIANIPGGFTGVLMYMFTPDCAEYGHYKSGLNMPGITFATQTFFVKLQAAFLTAFGSFILAALGFVEGENAVQAAGFADKLWTASCVWPAIGIILALIVLRFYKLNDHDVQLMAKCNAGEISRKEAQARMINKY